MTIASEVLAEYGDQYDPAWRTSDSALHALGALIDKYEVDSVVEFGPGLSSVVMIRAMMAPADGYIYLGVDHAGEWAIKHQQLLIEADLGNGLAPTIIAPLGPDEWYLIQKEIITMKFPDAPRLVFIDGPGSSTARGCKRAMEVYRSILAPYTIVVVDDTHRPTERTLANKIAGRAASEVLVIEDPNFARTTTIIIPAMLHQ